MGLGEQFSSTPGKIEKLFGLGIELARQAIESDPKTGQREIALSLGSLGSTLGEAQEYTGVYPPPYGPGPLDPFEDPTIEAITDWHLDRLRIYANTPAWSSVDWLAFETVPLLREVIAIRRAMRRLENESYTKAFWITCPFPKGTFPSGAGSNVQPEDILRAACASDSGSTPANGVGINCTHPRYISPLANQFTLAYRNLIDHCVLEPGRVVLVLYPDGGLNYDPEIKGRQRETQAPGQWAGDLAKVVKEVESASVGGRQIWKGVIAGGCCETSYGHMRELRVRVDELYSLGP